MNDDTRITTSVVAHTSRRVGHVTRPSSLRTSIRKRRKRPNQPATCSGDSFRLSNIDRRGSLFHSLCHLAGQEGLEPQPSVLETDALPVELLACKHRAIGLLGHWAIGDASPQ